jgi:hypothetical protein
MTFVFRRFRAISLTPLPLPMKLRYGLAKRGVSDKGLSIFLLIVVDRFLQFEEELGPQCIVIKMLNSIKLSISTSKLGIMQKFFNQGKYSGKYFSFCALKPGGTTFKIGNLGKQFCWRKILRSSKNVSQINFFPPKFGFRILISYSEFRILIQFLESNFSFS